MEGYVRFFEREEARRKALAQRRTPPKEESLGVQWFKLAVGILGALMGGGPKN